VVENAKIERYGKMTVVKTFEPNTQRTIDAVKAVLRQEESA